MTKPSIGFIGTGPQGQLAHLANYAQLRDAGECEIAGVTDLKPELAAAVARRYGVPKIYGSAAELLADPTVDAVVCVQQWRSNYTLVKQILGAGKAVLTEKPMVGRLDEAEELAALAAARGVLYAVGFMKRYDTGVALAKRLVDDARASGELGSLLTVDALCDAGDLLQNAGAPIKVDTPVPLPAAAYPDVCKTSPQRAAYDYLVNVLSHNINLCHFLLDAELEPRFAHFRSGQAMSAAARCGDVLVTIHGSVSPAHDWREWTTLTFERGQIVIRTPTPTNRQQTAKVSKYARVGDGFARTQHYAPIEWAFFRQAAGFVRALRGEEPLRAPAKACVWDVRVMQDLIAIAEVV